MFAKFTGIHDIGAGHEHVRGGNGDTNVALMPFAAKCGIISYVSLGLGILIMWSNLRLRFCDFILRSYG